MKVQLAYPIGRKIMNIREMTKVEAEREGWDWGWEGTPVLELDDGNIVYASADPEGNGPGMLYGYLIEEDQAIYIEPLRVNNDN